MADENAAAESQDDSVDIEAAVTAAQSEVEEPAVEEALAEETPAKEEPAAEEAPEKEAAPEKKLEPEAEEKDFDLELTAEQLEKINENPELLAVYKSVQRGATKKFQSIAEQRKQLEAKVKVAEFIEANPDKALEILAEKRGRRIAPPEAEAKKDEAVDELFKEWEEKLGGRDAAEAFYPLLRKSFNSFYEKAIAPLQEAQQRQLESVQAQEYAAGVAQFEATVRERGEEFNDEIQHAMAEKMKTIQAAEGTDLQSYLNTLYDAVAMDRTRLASKASALKRLRAAQKKDEPTVPTRAAKPESASITEDMDDDDAIALAVKMAEAG